MVEAASQLSVALDPEWLEYEFVKVEGITQEGSQDVVATEYPIVNGVRCGAAPKASLARVDLRSGSTVERRMAA